jgi:alpha-amylase/alpha-mannosidase (GH57 family)
MAHPPALIVHGHFYQPPRDNPWTGIVDREPSAAPFHDWNERIYRECYRPNARARIFDDRGKIEEIVNNYARLSFNFGPTLLAWLERQHPSTYRRIVEADKKSRRERGGHGNAIAQGYNHAILPLCNDRDLRTQIRWGLHEFRFRFGRDAEALWLPETACDERVLAALIEEKLRYVILAPGQAKTVTQNGNSRDVSDGSIDPRVPYRYVHPDGSGRSIALFFYDGPLARAIAFEGALRSSSSLIERVERASGGEGTVVHAATDGETFGHHFKFGDRCLAYALEHQAKSRGLWVTNYGELLDRHAPEDQVELALGDDGLGSSWSCAHGVGRWFRDCGCHTGGKPDWNQAWRTPLREALDGLRDEAARIFEEQGELLGDPWAVRDAYIEIVVDRKADRKAFFERAVGRRLSDGEQVHALRLLEMQKNAMLMYTSCGWFFSDLSGIETVQVMRYAGRLVGQLGELGLEGHEQRFLERLALAKSNVTDRGNGADIYRTEVLPARVDDALLAAHISLSALPLELPPAGELAGRSYRLEKNERERRGRLEVSMLNAILSDLATGVQSSFTSLALFFGGVDLHCVLSRYLDDGAFEHARRNIWTELDQPLLRLLAAVQRELGDGAYGLHHVLPSGREAISHAIFAELKGRYAIQYEAMYQEARAAIAQFHGAGLPLPEELRMAAQLALAHRFDQEIERAPATHFEPAAYTRALDVAGEAARYGCSLRLEAARRHFETHLARLIGRVCAGDSDNVHGTSPARAALELYDIAERLGLELNLDRAQEQLYFALRGGLAPNEPLAALATKLELAAGLYS